MREIIEIDESLCTGCSLCIPNCHEGALQIVDGKARMISDLFCDGLGACIGSCPEGAMKIVKREANGLAIIQLDIYSDSRGYFFEFFNEDKLKDLDIPVDFVQDNHSRSHANVLRGLHFQKSPSQGRISTRS